MPKFKGRDGVLLQINMIESEFQEQRVGEELREIEELQKPSESGRESLKFLF